jgi:hypothetical protein
MRDISGIAVFILKQPDGQPGFNMVVTYALALIKVIRNVLIYSQCIREELENCLFRIFHKLVQMF